MSLPGSRMARRSFRWARSRFARRAVVLGYHRVSDPTSDPYSLTISPEHFAEHMGVIRELATPINLKELVSDLRKGTMPKRCVVVTMDDGYVDNLLTAKPLLEAFDVPATVFVVAANQGLEFWWDELFRLLKRGNSVPADLRLDEGHGWSHSAGSASVTHVESEILFRLHRQLSSRSAEERRRRLDELRTIVGTPVGNKINLTRCMTASEVRSLVSSGRIEIGAHSCTHAALANLAEEDQWKEIRLSKEILENLLDRSVTSFSFPHGSHTELTRRLVSEAGFMCACRSGADVVVPGSDPYAIPRFWPPDCSGQVFRRWLTNWL